MKRIVFLIFTFIPLFLFACNLGFTPGRAYYYIQQQSEDEDTELIPPTEDIELSLNYMFDILEPKGVIQNSELEALLLYYQGELSSDEALLQTFYNQIFELPVVKKAADTNFSVIDLSTYNFNDALIRAEFSSKNVPAMRYESGSLWTLSEDKTYLPPLGDENLYTYEYTGDNTTAGVNPITGVTYLKYEGYNPFFAIDSKYNQALLVDGSERGMQRFIFYRFKGKGGGIVNLDNMLVAVDTHTALIFSFGVPTEFETILGQDSPTKWEAVEVAATAPDGQKYKFYEYDPAGYLDEFGNFVMYDWYVSNLSQANAANQTNFYPQYTGVSPYLVNFDVKKPSFNILNNAGDDINGYYTELRDFTFNEPPGLVATYDVYRIDDSGIERKLIATLNASDSGAFMRDRNALILTNYPQYLIEARDSSGNLIGSPSDLQEGKRDLTHREISLSVMESMRYALIDQGAHGSITGSKVVTSEGGGTFTYKKSGLFTGTYTYTLANYKPYLFTLNTAENASISYQAKNVLTSIQTSTPFTGTLGFSGLYSGTMLFNDIIISNNEKESPAWTGGSLDVTAGGYTTNYSFDGDQSIPFGFYMSKDTFVQSLLDENGAYTQK